MKNNHALHLFTQYLKNKNFSKNTFSKYTREVRDFLIFIQKDDVREISKEDILSYRKNIYSCARYAKSTQRGIILSLLSFFKYLSKNEYILINPFDTLDLRMKKVETKRESISEAKLKKFLDGINGNNYLDLRDRAIFELIYGSGLRVGEVRHLNTTDIDLNAGKIFIEEGKGKKDRIVPIGKNTLSYIKKYIKNARCYLDKIIDSEALFLSINGKRMCVETIEYSLKKRFKKSFPGEKICPHMLRHSFATHMLEAGATIKHIKDILGHSSIQTTVAYTHFNVKSMKKILKMYHPRENELYEEVDEKELKKQLT